ncbi:hypothetical protein HPB52_021561 [Rhipicephalus sanguineus]|uniref:Uncharacterized protein n=1 Tax=Rhipicephalus sanguineus TaxID=34632 RepID=A0A9D4PEV2_RHISA|nr:hypothetical protein HPB52_021561 [Rhipicephalus sanguineus]
MQKVQWLVQERNEEFSLKTVCTVQENANSKQYLEAIVRAVAENLKCLVHAPSVQMHHVPPDMLPCSRKQPAGSPGPEDAASPSSSGNTTPLAVEA